MKTVKEYPPNYAQLQMFFPLDLEYYPPLFPYGDTLYAPHHDDIPDDVMFHEDIHSKQQANDPAKWWMRYCTDPMFRIREELQAYASQYLWIRNKYGAQAGEEAIEELADNLSSPLYNLNISHGEAKCKIRNRAKRIMDLKD